MERMPIFDTNSLLFLYENRHIESCSHVWVGYYIGTRIGIGPMIHRYRELLSEEIPPINAIK